MYGWECDPHCSGNYSGNYDTNALTSISEKTLVFYRVTLKDHPKTMAEAVSGTMEGAHRNSQEDATRSDMKSTPWEVRDYSQGSRR